jgi:enoyl-CoA hydratase/carnithine racemase
LAFTGRRIDAEQALSLGIVQQISRREELDGLAMGIAKEIAAQAPLAIQGIKRTINGYVDQGLSDALRFEAMSAAVEFVSEDMTKGYAAKASKTDADFEGC